MDLEERVRKELNRVLGLANDNLGEESLYTDEGQLKEFGRLLTINELWEDVETNGESLQDYPNLSGEAKQYLIDNVLIK